MDEPVVRTPSAGSSTRVDAESGRTSRVKVCAGVLGALLASCGVGYSNRPLDLAPSTRSLLLVFEHRGELAVVAQAVNGQTLGIPQIAADPTSPVAALEYERTLADLTLEEGVVALVPGGVPLPQPIRAWSLASPVAAWEPSLGMPVIAQGARIAGTSEEACRASGACQRQVSPLRFACSQACPAIAAPASPAPPASPEAPAPPVGLGRTCAPTWRARTSESMTWCEPPAPVTCAPGTHQGLDDTDCPTIDSCARAIPGDALWVAPGAAGDGSRASPLGDLSAAIGAARAGRTIALSGAGSLGPITIGRPVILRGACDGSVSIGSVIVTSTRAELVGVTLQGPVEVRSGAHLDLDGSRLAGAPTTLVVQPRATVAARRLTIDGTVAVSGAFAVDELVSQSSAGPNFVVDGEGSLIVRRARLAQLGPHTLVEALGPNASVEFHETWMRSSGEGLLARGARVWLDRIGAEGTSIALTEAAHLVATEAVLNLSTAAIRVVLSEIELADVIMTADASGPENVIYVATGTATLSRVAASTLVTPLLTAVSSSVAIADLAISGARAAGITGVGVIGGTLHMRRFNVGTPAQIECAGGAAVWLVDGQVQATVRPSLAVKGCTMDARRMAVVGLVQVIPPSELGVATLDLSDASVDAGTNDLGMSVGGPGEVRLERVRVFGASERGLRIWQAASVRATDVEIIATEAVFGLHLSGRSSVELSRSLVREGLVAISSSDASLVGSDVAVVGAATGLSVDSTQIGLELRRLLARDSTGAGLSIGGVKPGFILSDLELRDNAVGVELASDQPLGDVLDTALFRGNREPAVACAHWPCVAR